MSTAIVIPARYGSSRLPGKPLKQIAGHTMLERVVNQAKKAVEGLDDVTLYIATEDERIYEYAKTLDAVAVMTPQDCATGSDRVYHVVQNLEIKPDIILNLQGDVPLVEPAHIRRMIEQLQQSSNCEVATPVVRLTWKALEALEQQKLTTPFSGTTVTMKANGESLWFSKNIIPAIRKREALEKMDPIYSPVFKHIGLYAYRFDALEKFVHLPEGHYEQLEGLEQLRLLENNIAIYCVPVEVGDFPLGIGVDTEEDVKRVEALIVKYGDPMLEQVGE